jgi:hypothetical protein
MSNKWLMNIMIGLVQRFSSFPMFFLIFIVKTLVVETFDLLPLPISFPLVLELSESG